MREVHEKARNSLQNAASRQKQNYDRRAAAVQLQAGQFVWMRKKTREKGFAPKLQPRWLGPFLVVTKLSDVTFRLQLTPRAPPVIVHADRLKPYTGVTREVWQFQTQNPRLDRDRTQTATQPQVVERRNQDSAEEEVAEPRTSGVNYEHDDTFD